MGGLEKYWKQAAGFVCLAIGVDVGWGCRTLQPFVIFLKQSEIGFDKHLCIKHVQIWFFYKKNSLSAKKTCMQKLQLKLEKYLKISPY